MPSAPVNRVERRAAVGKAFRLAHLSGPSAGRPWWAHFEFSRINIEPTILRKKFEDVRGASGYRRPSESLRADVLLISFRHESMYGCGVAWPAGVRTRVRWCGLFICTRGLISRIVPGDFSPIRASPVASGRYPTTGTLVSVSPRGRNRRSWRRRVRRA
jgi:hypothetical protein